LPIARAFSYSASALAGSWLSFARSAKSK
jgi:hypothetical protein